MADNYCNRCMAILFLVRCYGHVYHMVRTSTRVLEYVRTYVLYTCTYHGNVLEYCRVHVYSESVMSSRGMQWKALNVTPSPCVLRPMPGVPLARIQLLRLLPRLRSTFAPPTSAS